MKNITEKYKALAVKHQIIIAIVVFILFLFILPNSIVYAITAFTSYKLINKKGWKYISTIAFCIFTFFSLILWISGDVSHTQVADSIDTSKTQEQKIVVSNQVDTATTTSEMPTPTSTQTATKTKIETPIVQTKTQNKSALPQSSTSEYTYYSVTSVVDGDTIKISMNGKVETLRLIGIDTPETVDPRKSVQCFGKEASNKAKELLSGKKVRIEMDSTQGERDKYDRLLAYIYRDDGLFYNKSMIEQGYAHEYTYNTPYKYQTEFKTAQKSAQTAQLVCGLQPPVMAILQAQIQAHKQPHPLHNLQESITPHLTTVQNTITLRYVMDGRVLVKAI